MIINRNFIGIFVACSMLISLSACTTTPYGTTDVLDANRASGIVTIGFSANASMWAPLDPASMGEKADWSSGTEQANTVCRKWGYKKGAEPINSKTARTVNFGSNFGDIYNATYWRKYQCVGNPDSNE